MSPHLIPLIKTAAWVLLILCGFGLLIGCWVNAAIEYDPEEEP